MSKRSWFYAFISALFCSAAVALQPTVRAGSISLGGSAKPVTPSVTPTSTQSSSVSSANRGAAVSKFSQGTIVPVSTSASNNNNVSSSLIEELKQRIAELELARTALEGRQDSLESSQSQTDNAIDSVTAQVQSISSTNSDLNDAVSTLQSNSTTLQSTLNSIQQQANSLSDSLNTNIDSRLQYRGLLDSSNNIAFVTKNDITAEKLATKIATNPGAAETLSRSITPTVVSADSVTTALNDSETFKDMVSRAATEKGFAKTTALETNTARIADLESTTGSLQVKVDGDVDTQGSLLYAIKNDDTIRDALKGDPGENGTSVDVDDVVNALKNDAKFIGDTKGRDAKTTWYEYCVKGDNLTAIIQQVYPEVGDCESFTNEQFTELTNGARSKCLSWALTPEELSTDEGVGKKLVKIFGSGILNNLTSYHAGTRIVLPNSSVAVNFVIACEKKYDEIMAGDDAKSVEQKYCEAQADNYPNGVTNLDLIKKLYTNVNSCDDFTIEMYTNITSGAKAYCKSLAQNPEDLSADSGIGLRLEQTFGAGIVETLKFSKLDTAVNVNGTRAAKNFVEACVENFDAIMAGKDAKSVEQVYCEAQAENYNEGITNLTIIQKLYSTVRTCDDFTPEMYTAITSGAKGYCKSLAQKPEDLSADSGIGLKLERTFGTGIVASLKTNKLDTVVSINGAKAPKNFVEACEENYDAIMAGKDAKSVEQLYCEAQADNYPEGTTNLTIIQKLYSTVRTCDDFTPEMYTAITSGAKGYCKSLAQKPEDLSADSGIGLKLEKTFGTGIVASLKTNKLDTVVSINGAKAPKNFVEACVENYDEIMAGKDAKSVEQVYCEAQADNYPEGTTNLAAIITKLYPLVTSCDEFTIEMYTNLTSGATAYCKSLALNPNDLTAGTGIGKRLTQLFGESIIQDLQRDGLDTSIAPKGAKAAKKFVELCVENYDAIMAGKDAKSIEQAYCESRAENYDENTTNLTIIQKFYPSVTNCDMFTAEMYTAITSGAKGYCLSLAKKPEDLNSGTGIGAKLVKIFGNTVIEDLQAHGLETNVFIDGAKGAKTFLEACEENYDAIMTGKDAEPIEMIYCHAQAENYPEGTTNEDLIKKLYPIDDCSEFTYEMYTAITTGAKAYCKSLAQKPASLSADEGIGKKLAETFGSGIISNLKTNKLDARVTIAVKSNSMEKSSTNVEMSFVEACEKKYDEIMSGKNAKSVEQTYCENDDNLTKIITPLFGITDCADFDSSKYQAIVGGAKAYCLSLATEPEKLTEDNTMTKKLKKVFGSDIISKLTTNGAGAIVQSTKNGAKAAEDVKFVDECAARYDEIMGILPIETEFCESEDRLEKIIKPLYGNDKTCENFTNAEYQAIMGGAKAYCLSLVNDAKNNKLDANIGIGAKLEKILGTGIINQVKTGGAATPVTITKNGAKAATDTNFVLACEEKYNEIVAGDDALGFTYRDKVATYNDLPETCEQGDGYQVEDADQTADWQGLLYICNCHTVDNVQSCSFPDRGKGVKFQGPKGEDGKSPEQTYCETNFTTVNALYSSIENVNECNEFTAEQYKAMMEGAKTYCLFIAQDFISGNLEINKGIGKKLDKELKLYGTDDGIFALKERKAPITLSEMLQTQKFNNNQSFLDACEEKYNQIMSGDDGKDAKSVEQTYCEAAYEKDNTTTNLEAIIKPLYGNAMTCETFTAEQYNAIMGGAKAYCLSLAADPAKLTNDNAITKKLKKTFGDSIVATLTEGGIGTTITRSTKAGDSTVKFVDECARRYDEIMSGDDGKDAKSAEQTYCETNFATVSALYSGIAIESDCANFTAEQYKAMMEGAKAYCLLLAQDFANNKLSSTTGIGKKMNERLKIGTTDNGIFSMETKTLANVLSANTKFNGTSDTFLTACEKNYNEIMSGEKGADGEDAVKTWCRAHTLDGAKSGGTVAKTLSAAKLVAAFKASGNTDTQIEKSQDNTTGEVTGYFKTLEACIAAVNEDPTIMSGESAAETQYNEDVKKEKKEGNTNFTLGSNTVTTFETKKNTFGSKMVTADNIGTKLIENKVVTDDNFKNKLKTDLDTNDVKSVLKTAGFAESTEITTMRDNLLNGDENTVGSIANKVKTAGFAKTNDVVTKTGFAEQLQNDLNAENSTVKSALSTAGFAKTADVVTNTDFKNKLKTDLESNDVKTVLKTAGFAESTEITTMRDNLLNGDENTVGSIANKVKTAGFAKTDDVVTKTGFADQLEADLNKNDSTIKTALGNTFASKGTVESLSGTVNTLTGNESTEGSIAYKLKDFAKTNDVVTKTGFAEQLQNDLNAENSTVKSALSTAGFAKTADVVTNTDFKNKLKTNLADSEVKSTLETAGFAKTNDVVTKTGFAEQLQNDLNAENSSVKSALATAGFAKTADVVTNTDFKNKLKTDLESNDVKTVLKTAGFAESTEITTMRDNLLNGDENTVGSIANKVKTAGFAKTADVVTNTDFKNKLKTNLADSEVKSTLETAGFAKSDAVTALATRTNTLETKAITTDNLNTKMTNAGFAKSADVVSTSNFATQLQNSLTNNNVKSALADAGFAKSDVTDTVVTMSDLSKLLSGGLIVDSDGSVKLNSKSSKATSIENKIIEAKAKTNDNNIQTTGLKATTSITASIANVAASAAAASNEEINESKCNEMEYMFWDSYFEGGKGKCEKCPEGTYFNPESIKQQNLPRCICEDKALTFGYADDEWKCVPSGDTDCQNKENTYWNGNACNECPPETYFNPESMKNSNLPRCVCEDKTATFNASSGQCTPAGASACAGMGMIWSSAENKCIDCPDSAPFDDQTHTCVCKETEMIFSSQKMACIKCDAGQIEQYGECVEADENMCAQDSRYFWHIDENRCMSCPDYAPYDAILGRCTCKDEGWAFTPKTASCEECPGDTEYNSSTKTCTCKEPGQTFNVNDWTCQ